MYILCLLSALSRGIVALQIYIIIITTSEEGLLINRFKAAVVKYCHGDS